MSFTFSSNEDVDYPALGMCPICAVRFTHGCEHSNTMEAQEWLAAHIVAEQGQDVDLSAVSALVAAAEAGDNFLNNSDIAITAASYNIDHCHPADKDWAQRRYNEEVEKRHRTIREAGY